MKRLIIVSMYYYTSIVNVTTRHGIDSRFRTYMMIVNFLNQGLISQDLASLTFKHMKKHLSLDIWRKL